ncbi:hypothetical protein [Micromonospora sp. 067-2]|uniref:hypothetical protein n=1 Tax=Micromonospora sp. 067-2 TaxID=2789270 RepID=UPI003978B527
MPSCLDLWVYGDDVDVCVSFAQVTDEVRLLINERVLEQVGPAEALRLVAEAVGEGRTGHLARD